MEMLGPYWDADYQSNMTLIDEALQRLGVVDEQPTFTDSLYDERLRKLIDSVPLE